MSGLGATTGGGMLGRGAKLGLTTGGAFGKDGVAKGGAPNGTGDIIG
jgi:hypothetical protein